MNGSVKKEATERIKNAENFHQLVRDILWKWKMPKACLKVGACPY
jgi:hypothetical protein